MRRVEVIFSISGRRPRRMRLSIDRSNAVFGGMTTSGGGKRLSTSFDALTVVGTLGVRLAAPLVTQLAVGRVVLHCCRWADVEVVGVIVVGGVVCVSLV